MPKYCTHRHRSGYDQCKWIDETSSTEALRTMSEQSKTPLQEIIRCQRSINVFEFPSDGSTDLTNEADTNPFIDTNLNSRISKSHVTLLSRQYHYVLPCTLLMYILLQYIIGSRSNICSTYREPAAESTNIAYYCAGACFFMSGVQQLVRILSYRNQSVGCMSRSIFLAALTVSLIAGSSSYLTGNSPIKQISFLVQSIYHVIIIIV